jgi:hypothetical protein
MLIETETSPDHHVWDVRRGRAAGDYTWQLHPQYDGNTPKGRSRSLVGQWAPTLLILGLYNKLVKQHGSDFTDTRA